MQETYYHYNLVNKRMSKTIPPPPHPPESSRGGGMFSHARRSDYLLRSLSNHAHVPIVSRRQQRFFQRMGQRVDTGAAAAAAEETPPSE
jgi:hypothetical protein